MPSERLIRAIELARSGHKAAAREILEEIVRAEPTNEAAWLWLADTQPNDAARLQVLREAQKYLPRSANIAKALAIIGARLRAAPSSGVAPSPAAAVSREVPPTPPSAGPRPAPVSTSEPPPSPEPSSAAPAPSPSEVAPSEVEALRRVGRLRRRPVWGVVLVLVAVILGGVLWFWPGSPLPGWVAVLLPAATPTLESLPPSEPTFPLATTEVVLTEEVLPTEETLPTEAMTPEGVMTTEAPPLPTVTPEPTSGPPQLALGVPILALDGSARANLIALATQTGVGLYDATTLARVRYLENPANPPRLAFSPDGRWLVTNGAATRLWNVESGEVSRTLSTAPIAALAFSPDGQQIALAEPGGQVRLVPREADSLPTVILPAGSNVFALAFSPDGNRLAAALEDGRTLVWNLSTRTILFTRIPETGRTLRLAYSPRGEILAGGNEDGGIWLWDGEGNQISVLRGPSGMIFTLAFSPDGKRLAASGEDPALYIWTLSDGQLQQRIEGPTRPVHGLRFTPDGTQLLSADEEGVVRFWALTP
ncbi:MAG: hypothetical protein N3A60_03850 [Thermanaerothrix sp.]|nr:hypothetical protein [Thermanaerothrix sp.]